MKTKTKATTTPAPKEATRPACVRTAHGLRDVLFDALDDLRSGKIDANKAGATARVAAQIVDSVKLQIEWTRAAPQGRKSLSFFSAAADV